MPTPLVNSMCEWISSLADSINAVISAIRMADQRKEGRNSNTQSVDVSQDPASLSSSED